jgi:hypothetical protein
MNSADLDSLDSAIAGIEGPTVAFVGTNGEALCPDSSPYRPTRDPNEALRLLDKYIDRVVKLNGAWAAVGPCGRACVGPTLPIAVCKAIVEAR